MRNLARISYVEDDADIRAVAELTLSDVCGYQLQTCASGAEALERVAGFAPDIILLDRRMPGLDGIETFARLRAIPELTSTPIAFMTANADADDIARYQAMGAAGVIAKPFDPMTLGDEIEALWRQSGAGKGEA